MFFHSFGHSCGSKWSMSGRSGGEDPRGKFGGRGGPFGRHRGGPFGGRGGRMFDAGALRLVVLGLIAEEPRHGYDVIKALEARFHGAYSPSPGAIYPMLQMMEEADLVASDVSGNKRRYSITEQGRAYLAEHADELAKINAQIDEASTDASGAALSDEVRALTMTLFSRLRGGSLTSDQADKAREILKRARKDLEDL